MYPRSRKGKSTMTNTSTGRAGDFWSIGRKVLTTIAMASAVMTLSVSPALADRDGNHGRGDRHGKHSQQHWRGDHDGYYRQANRYQQTYRQPYYYAQPVYVPPPVYYEPQRSPGISLFFPLDLRR